MTDAILDVFKLIVTTFGGFFSTVTTDLNQLTNSTAFPEGLTLISLMFGAGFVIFLGVTLVKWIV